MSEVTQYEALVIGAAMMENSLIADLAETLRVEDFAGDGHAEIWKAIIQAKAEGQPADIVTVSEGCSVPLVTLAEYARGTYSTNPEQVSTWAQIIRERARRERLAGGLHAIAVSGSEADDMLTNARELLMGMDQDTKKERSNRDITRERLNAFSDRYDGLVDSIGLTCGVRDLDKLLYGFKPAELIVLAARPAMGKSAFALQAAQINAIDHRKRVAFFSLEMGVDEVFDRILVQRSKVPADRFAVGKGCDQAEIDKIGASGTLLAEADLHCFDNIFTIEGVTAKCQRLHQKAPVDMIVVDYLQLLSTRGRANANRAIEVGDYSRQLKMLAMQLNCPVLVLSQLNREVEKRPDKRPLMADLRESGSVEQDANKIVMLYRDEVYDPNSSYKNVAELIVRKSRGGKTGIVPAAANMSCFTFGDLSRDYQQQEAPRHDPFA